MNDQGDQDMFKYKFDAKRWILLSLSLLVLLAGSILGGKIVYATPPTGGIVATPIASSKLPEPVDAKFKEVGGDFGHRNSVSNVNVTKYIVPAGASFGWHQHSGPVWVIITSGTLTYYQADGSNCVWESFSAGSAFFDPGNDTHIANNEGSETVELYAVFMLPEGGAPRIDQADPGVCPSN